MKNVLIVLPSAYDKLETFLKQLVDKLAYSKIIKFNFTYSKAKFDLEKLFFLLKLLFHINNILKYYRTLNNEMGIYEKLKKIYFNSNLLVYKKLDIIHFTFANLAIGSYTVGKIYNANLSIGLRGYDISYFPLNHINCYSNEYWSHIDYIQTNSDDLYNNSLKWGASPTIPVFKINAAVNDEFILVSDKLSIREDYLDGKVRLLFIGRLHWKKGLESLIRLLLISKKKDIELYLTIVGSGPELEKLNYLIWKYELTDQIILKGKLDQLDILALIDETDIVVAPSLQEGCSNVVLESQSRGKYCIVSDAEGMNEVVVDGVTGAICRDFDEEMMFNKILDYSKINFEKRKEMAKISIDRIKDNFSRSLQMDKWELYFERFIK